jgi:hypothetical protein
LLRSDGDLFTGTAIASSGTHRAARPAPPSESKSIQAIRNQSHDSRQQNVLGDVVDHRASATAARDSVVLIWQSINEQPYPKA